MSPGNNAFCNDGRNSHSLPTARRQRTCTELGVCQGRTPPCLDACANPPIVPGGLPVRLLGAEPVDTYRLPPGGFWFAPGTIESKPASGPLNGLEKSLIVMVGTGVVAFLTGLGYGWWKGLL